MVLPTAASRVLVPRILVLAGLILCGSLLKADVIYTNFGTGLAYYPGSGVIVTNGSEDFSVAIELPVMTGNYYLSSIEFVATVENPDPSNYVTVSIYADDGGVPGGSPLESLSTPMQQIYDFNGQTAPVLEVNSVLNPELYEGMDYWVVMDGPVDEGLVWDLNSTRTSGYDETDGTAGNWIDSFPDNTNGVFEVDGCQVQGGCGTVGAPEPQAWLLMLGGMALVARLARRQTAS